MKSYNIAALESATKSATDRYTEAASAFKTEAQIYASRVRAAAINWLHNNPEGQTASEITNGFTEYWTDTKRYATDPDTDTRNEVKPLYTEPIKTKTKSGYKEVVWYCYPFDIFSAGASEIFAALRSTAKHCNALTIKSEAKTAKQRVAEASKRLTEALVNGNQELANLYIELITAINLADSNKENEITEAIIKATNPDIAKPQPKQK